MRRVLAGLALVSLTACGSTVQGTGTVGAPAAVQTGDGLTAPGVAAPGEVLAPGEAPVAVGDPAGGTTGSGTTGSEPTGAGTGATTATGGPAEPGSAPAAGTPAGATKTGPVKVGFINTKVGNAESFGVNVGQTYTTDQVFRSLVKAMNANGGVAGRRIEPVTADTDTASGDWSRDFQAACEKLTRDDKVAVVVGYSFAFFTSFEACLAKAGVPHLNGAYTVGDEQTLGEFPTLFATNALTADRRYRLQIEGAVRDGFVTKASKIGLLLDDCPEQVRAVKRTVDPLIRQLGLTEAARATFSCPAGAGDTGAVASQVQAAVLRFRERGVDRVFLEGVPMVVFAQSAESQGYRPGYFVTSTTGGAALEPNIPKAQLANVRGYGWMPQIDVNANNHPPKTASQQRCLTLLKSQGVVPSQYNDFHSAYTTCDGLFLYEAALRRTGGDERAASVAAAIGALGSTHAGVGVHETRTSFAGGRREAPAVYRAWSYVGDCSCFRFRSAALPIP